MKITFYGATEGVTGSNHIIEAAGKKFLVDCGLFQGGDKAEQKNWEEFPYNPAEIDFVILTHSHIDHMGRLPFLCKSGFKGKVYATRPTEGFSGIFLRDTANIMKNTAERLNEAPLFDSEDVENVLKLYESYDYYQVIKPAEGIEIKFYDAGHILGSSIVEVKSEGKTVIFSGDLGNPPVPILRDTDAIKEADYVVMEATYGDRNHAPATERKTDLERAIEDTVAKGGVVLMPSFAMERTQEILYEINELADNNRIPKIPIYLDSPLAAKATEVYKQFPQYFDDEAKKLLKAGDDFFSFPTLHFVKDQQESMLLDQDQSPKVIIAGSGMSTGGKIVFHEKAYLPKESTLLLIVGFQVEGTPGRLLKDGEKQVKIAGEQVQVNAKVQSIESYSAHADQTKLTYWISRFEKPIKKVFLVHGEESAKQALKSKIEDEKGCAVVIPKEMEEVEL